MNNEKKFLDQAGVEYLWSKIDMQDYPNNETLTAVINAIDENKADKEYVDEKIENSIITSWNDLEDRPFGIEETVRLQAEFVLDSSKTKYSFYPVGVLINRQKQWLDGDELVFVIDGVAELRVPQSGTTARTGSIVYDNVRFEISGFKLVRVKGGTLWSAEFTATDLTGAGLSKSYTVDARYVSVNVATLDPKFLPEEAQPDWNQNDENAPNYVKNRPFYYIQIEKEGVIVTEYTTPTEDVEESSSGRWYYNQGFYANIKAPGAVDNYSYTVIYDGVTYSDVYKEVYTKSNSYHDTRIGDTNLVDYPFYFELTEEEGVLHAYFSTGGEHTFKIIADIPNVAKPMDEIFLPESVAKTTLRSTTEESTKKFDVTVDDEGNLSTTDVETGETKVIGSGSGGGVTSWNDLTDRPFYEEEEGTLTIIVPEVTVSGSDSYYENPFNIEIIEGNNYTVKFDGVTYECTAYIAEGPNTPSIGNGIIGGAGTVNNNEPFFCTVYNGNVMLFTSDSDTHTIEIISETVTTVIHKIDKKFLPEKFSNIDTKVSADSTNLVENKAVAEHFTVNTVNGLVMVDQRTGYRYVIQILDGNVISSGYCLDIRISDKCNVKDRYIEGGDSFNINDLIVEGICDDGTIKVIEHYTTDIIDNTVVITYKEVDNIFKLNVTTIVDIETGLQDFYYTKGDDGIYTLTGWKGTYNGEPSTRCIIPDSPLIKLQ